MSFERLPGGAVLVDDLLLDCPPGLVARLAFGGPPLTRVRTVLLTADGEVDGHRDGTHRGETWTASRCGDGWLVESATEGLLLHCPRGRADGPAGAVLTVANPEIAAPLARANRRVLVTGGARSGKSRLAEDRFAGRPVDYVATGPRPQGDDEWAARIAAHRLRRPATWRTHETLDVAGVLAVDGDAALVDGLGTWVAGALDRAGWTADLDTAPLVQAFATTTRDVVVVTDEVGDGVVPEHASGRRFRDELGRLNAALARLADEVWRVTAGIGTRLR